MVGVMMAVMLSLIMIINICLNRNPCIKNAYLDKKEVDKEKNRADPQGLLRSEFKDFRELVASAYDSNSDDDDDDGDDDDDDNSEDEHQSQGQSASMGMPRRPPPPRHLDAEHGQSPFRAAVGFCKMRVRVCVATPSAGR